MTPYACRICRSPDHQVILDFGDVALADAFLSTSADIAAEQRYPLTLILCRSCRHVQIKEILDPRLLFTEYVWETGISTSVRQYCRDFVETILSRRDAPRPPRVLEIASNDGTMLAEFQLRGCDVLGVDPARNIARKANAAGVPTIADFFGERLARELLTTRGPCDVVVARNVLAHVADLHGLVAGIGLLLAPDGMAVIEVPHLLSTHEELQYDQVFHEHIGYHSLDSVIRVFGMHGMAVVDAEQPRIHGGSLRAYVAHAATGREPTAAVRELLSREKASGILDAAGWRSFGDRVARQRHLLRQELSALRAAGRCVVGYGASAKGQAMIQCCGLDETLVRYVADKSPLKIGKLAPGSHIPIVGPERMRHDPVDVVLLFAWNLADEIVAQEESLRRRGVRFLHPIPEPHYLGEGVPGPRL